MASVKDRKGPKPGPVATRLATLLNVFSPWDDISLTYRQFAADLGAPVSATAVKKWPHRKNFPVDVARLIVQRAQDHGVAGVTLEWLLWGEGPKPTKAGRATSQPVSPSLPKATKAPEKALQEPHGRFASRIGQALEADLNHNEFGQWSSVEVQRTVTWALKDLARRLRVLRFDMGRTFELTDEWAGRIGLPVRQPERPFDDGE